MKTYGRVELCLHHKLVSAAVGRQWSTHAPVALPPEERDLGTLWIGRWGGGPCRSGHSEEQRNHISN
jgi:hypothetical protein